MLDKESFKGEELEGGTGNYSVKLRLNASEILEITMENRENYDTYFVKVRNEDIRKENIKNHCDYIETASELFQYIQFSLSESITFDEIVKVEPNGKIAIKLELTIDFKKGSKRRLVTYEFQAAKQTVTPVVQLRNQVTTLTGKVEKFAKRIQDLQQENFKLKQRLSQRPPEYGKDLVRYATNRSALVIKNDSLLQTQNKLNIILLGQHLQGDLVLEWKVRVCDKMVLIFGASPPDLTTLHNNALDQAISKEKLLTKEYLLGGEIITCVYQEGELKYTIQRVDVQEDQGKAEPSYNLRRGSFMCKKLLKVDDLYPCFGLHFGARIEILSINTKH